MLINLSNHPAVNWSERQLQAAGQYGKVADLTFPQVDPEADTETVALLSCEYLEKIRKMFAGEPAPHAVHLMGELTFCFALVSLLQKEGIVCLVSTTLRSTIDQADGSKISRFEFVRFREYGKDIIP